MNSDNMMIAGRTLDYGPFGWMEKYIFKNIFNYLFFNYLFIFVRYDPNYQPFTSDTNKYFSFINQFDALKMNMKTFSKSILYLLNELKNKKLNNSESENENDMNNIDYSEIIEHIITIEFDEIFQHEIDQIRFNLINFFSFNLIFNKLSINYKFNCKIYIDEKNWD